MILIGCDVLCFPSAPDRIAGGDKAPDLMTVVEAERMDDRSFNDFDRLRRKMTTMPLALVWKVWAVHDYDSVCGMR